MIRVFISYSHKDEILRKELDKHLAILKRQKTIDTWNDRKITPGQEFDKTIDDNLEMADIILLLVSPDFLASDYCYEVEMTRAMERHDQGKSVVIPVILEPCIWQKAPFGKILATPEDGKAVSKYPNKNDAFVEITKGIMRAVETLHPDFSDSINVANSARISDSPIRRTHNNRSSNLAVKREFSDKERDDFLDDSLNYIANFFEGSLHELENRNNNISTKFQRVDANRFSARIYKNGSIASQCLIALSHNGMGLRSGASIVYSSSLSGNSINESFSIGDDGYSLYLKPLNLMSSNRNKDEQFSQNGSSERLWSFLIKDLQ
jgi:TIR domain